MRWPEFLNWTPDERRAALAVILFTGGGGLLIEFSRRFPDWTPDLLLVSSLEHRRVAQDSVAAVDSLAPGEQATGDAPAQGSGALVVAGMTAGQPDPVERPPLAGARPSTGPVDLNRADAAELARLPGVGPKLAERIVEDRQRLGPYRQVADLDRVKGVGPALLHKIAALAVVTPASETTRSRHP